MHILQLLKLHLIPSEVIHPSSPTWKVLQEELAFLTQNALRDYFFTTKRSSTVAVISVLNAIEQLNDIEYEPFMRTLIDEVLKKFEFEDASTLVSRHRLRDLVAAEDDDCDSCDPERVCESPRGLSVHIGLQPKECPINLIENISVDITIQ